MSSRRRPNDIRRESDDPLRYPCPICGAGEKYACEPLRKTGYHSILRPHRERGAMPWVLERDGYVELADGLWQRPPGRSAPRHPPQPTRTDRDLTDAPTLEGDPS